MAINNPSKLAWYAPTQRVDGSSFTAAEFDHYELSLDGGPSQKSPSPYERPATPGIAGQATPGPLSPGNHNWKVRAVAKDNTVSPWADGPMFTIIYSQPNPPGTPTVIQ